MKIVIATPLYPPDIAEPAPYVKELATRISETYDVTVVLFGKFPEIVPNISYTAVDKQKILPIRLVRYFFALWSASKDAHVLYVLNGSSVELAAGILTLFRNIPVLVHLGDADANKWVNARSHLRFIKRFILGRASRHIAELPSQKPEILPFETMPEAELLTYEHTWKEHISNLETLFEVIQNTSQ